MDDAGTEGLPPFNESSPSKAIAMDDTEISLVQDSWAKVAPNAPAVAAAFYARLFELDPGLRKLFKADLTEQGGKLMGMLRSVVAGLRQLDALVPVAQGLAQRHVQYGVKAADYDTVGRALLDTLRGGLGDGFTPQVEAAWTKAYTLLSGVMIGAAAAKP
jgi:nitric oxide dioxygenase